MAATVEFAQGLDVEGLHKLVTSEEQITKANAFRTIPADIYRLMPVSVKVGYAGEKSPNPGRLEVSVQYAAFVRGAEDKKVGTVFGHFSPEMAYYETRDGEKVIDKAAKLWGQAAKAFDMTRDPATDIIQAIASFPVDGYVSEYIKKADGTYATPKSAEERTQLINEGGTPGNSLSSVGKVK